MLSVHILTQAYAIWRKPLFSAGCGWRQCNKKILHEDWHRVLKVAPRLWAAERSRCYCSWTGLKEGKCLSVWYRFLREYLDTSMRNIGEKSEVYRATLTGGFCLARVRKCTQKVVFAKHCRGGDSRGDEGSAVIGQNVGKPPPRLAVDGGTISASNN